MVSDERAGRRHPYLIGILVRLFGFSLESQREEIELVMQLTLQLNTVVI